VSRPEIRLRPGPPSGSLVGGRRAGAGVGGRDAGHVVGL